jgi:diphosphomevalonate decarboxylase
VHRVRELRRRGTAVFFTIDAGPQLKAVCTREARATVADALADVAGVERIIVSGLGAGARLAAAA